MWCNRNIVRYFDFKNQNIELSKVVLRLLIQSGIKTYQRKKNTVNLKTNSPCLKKIG